MFFRLRLRCVKSRVNNLGAVLEAYPNTYARRTGRSRRGILRSKDAMPRNLGLMVCMALGWIPGRDQLFPSLMEWRLGGDPDHFGMKNVTYPLLKTEACSGRQEIDPETETTPEFTV